MSYQLASPDSSAPAQDLRAWLEELRELSPTKEVKNAMRRAERMLKSQKGSGRRERPGSRSQHYDDND